jgi:UDP-N-acetylmuramoylalanine--D-glutamate ligase
MNPHLEQLIQSLEGKKILILGFGKEGQSTYAFLNRYCSGNQIVIADRNPVNIPAVCREHFPPHQPQSHHRVISGEQYLDAIQDCDMVIKSPGVSLKNIMQSIDKEKITSQTDLFLSFFSSQSVGITGTKGKSTTTACIYSVLCQLHQNVVMAGNMGIPLFDMLDRIDNRTKIILELSSHQLEFIRKSPHVGVLLNIFEEHLDHYNRFEDYIAAKYNIAAKQSKGDRFIYNRQDELIVERIKQNPLHSQLIPFSYQRTAESLFFVEDNYFCRKKGSLIEKICPVRDDFPLKGAHNLQNICAVLAVLDGMQEVEMQKIERFLYAFQPLPHRMERVGEREGIIFYNDSISTIAQATVAALKTLPNVNTLILGGFDRGIDYTSLADFCYDSAVEHFIFVGQAGKRMMRMFGFREYQKYFYCDNYAEVVSIAIQHTRKGCICLLSPAAASYDRFKNFEERGNYFKALVMQESVAVSQQ